MYTRILATKMAAAVLVLMLCDLSNSQTNPRNVPQPPNAQLQKFEPFLGTYRVSGDFANLPWSGTLELSKVIEGWYIRQIIKVKSPGIDREFWVLATWDVKDEKYRLWGFQTLPTALEGEIRFEGDEMITVWRSVAPDGATVFASNRYHFLPNHQLEVISYRQVENGPTEKIGTLTGTRMSNADDVSGSASDQDDLRALIAERRRAYMEGDIEAISKSMTDDYLQTDINGYRQDKTAWLNEYFKPLADLIKAGKFRWEVYDYGNLQFRSFGDCAIVTGSLELKGSGARPGPQHTWVPDASSTLSATLHFTHVYVKRNGLWLLAGLHNQLPSSNPQKQ